MRSLIDLYTYFRGEPSSQCEVRSERHICTYVASWPTIRSTFFPWGSRGSRDTHDKFAKRGHAPPLLRHPEHAGQRRKNSRRSASRLARPGTLKSITSTRGASEPAPLRSVPPRLPGWLPVQTFNRISSRRLFLFRLPAVPSRSRRRCFRIVRRSHLSLQNRSLLRTPRANSPGAESVPSRALFLRVNSASREREREGERKRERERERSEDALRTSRRRNFAVVSTSNLLALCIVESAVHSRRVAPSFQFRDCDRAFLYQTPFPVASLQKQTLMFHATWKMAHANDYRARATSP